MLNEYQQKVIDETQGEGVVVVQAVPGSGKTKLIEVLVSHCITKKNVRPQRIAVFTFSRKSAAELRRRIYRQLFSEEEREKMPERQEWIENADWENNGEEMKAWSLQDERVRFLLHQVCTLHGMCFRLLKEFYKDSKELSIFGNQWEQQVSKMFSEMLLEWKLQEPLSTLYHWIGQAELAHLDYNEKAKTIQWFDQQLFKQGYAQDKMELRNCRAKQLATCYRRFSMFCNKNNLLSFSKMLAETLHLIETSPTFAEFIANRFDYLIVDEAQDTDPIQTQIVWAMSRSLEKDIRGKGLIFVGDVDQTMYSFRGANPSVIGSWVDDYWSRFTTVRRYNLPINYRSTREIVNVSKHLISRHYLANPLYEKPFLPWPGAIQGQPIVFTSHPSLSKMILYARQTYILDPPFDSWFILSRTRAECCEIHLHCIANGIPAINHSGVLLFDLPHIEKVIAYAKLACNYRGTARNDLEIVRQVSNVSSIFFKAPFDRKKHECGEKSEKCNCPILLRKDVDYCPTRYYGQAILEKHNKSSLWRSIVEQQSEVFSSWEPIDQKHPGKKRKISFPSGHAKAARDFVEFVNKIESLKKDASSALRTIIYESVLPWYCYQLGSRNMVREENNSLDSSKYLETQEQDFITLLSIVHFGWTLEQFLDHVEMLREKKNDEKEGSDRVHIGTFHWSKGAESENVIVNMTRLPFLSSSTPLSSAPPTYPLPVGHVAIEPPPNCHDRGKQEETEYEEERRLFFVGMTRAKKKCILMQALEWQLSSVSTSCFINEISPMIKKSDALETILVQNDKIPTVRISNGVVYLD